VQELKTLISILKDIEVYLGRDSTSMLHKKAEKWK